jgi:transcriptional regulator
MPEDDDTLIEQQNEEYLKLREQGLSKQDAAAQAAPPDTTEVRANEEVEAD